MTDVVLLENPQAERRPYGAGETAALDPALAAKARADLRAWDGYAPTALHRLPRLAARLGVRSVVAKYEGERTELASFKALGGAYALATLLARMLQERGVASEVSAADLESGRFAAATGAITSICASDGNHGRSLAWGSRRFGCRCVIYLPRAVSEFRAEAIRGYGAEVVRVDGNYDDAVRAAARDAEANGWLLVADTATADHVEPPKLVMAGYSLLMDEAWAQLSPEESPTHILAQVGCGGLAAVVSSYVWSRLGAARPTIVGVEPATAACLMETVCAGCLAVVEGEHETVMGGLACGEMSWLAWEVLRGGLDFALTIADGDALEAVRGLADGEFGSSLEAGESGAAGLGGLLAIEREEGLRRRLGIGPDSRIMVVITEGATDPGQFEAILRGERA